MAHPQRVGVVVWVSLAVALATCEMQDIITSSDDTSVAGPVGDPLLPDGSTAALLSATSSGATRNLKQSPDGLRRRCCNCKYTIKSGDTLFALAEAQGTTVAALTAANPGIVATNLQIGQVINLPGCSTTNTPTTAPTTPTASPTGASKLSTYLDSARFEEFFKHRGDSPCPGAFYTHAALVSAASAFPAFVSSRDDTTNKRELAAFLAHISHETTGGWPSAPDGPYRWGLCFTREGGVGALPSSSYCDSSNTQYPCAAGKAYYGRGPMQLSWNYNYGQSGSALGLPLLSNPDLVLSDPVVAFKTALWFWMTPQSPKPSCHDVMTGNWVPTATDSAAGRAPGFGVTTSIINGGIECGKGSDPLPQEADRVGFYKSYCDGLGVGYGDNLFCGLQRSF